jgi:hypothetical protein
MAALFGADDRVAKRTSKRVEWASPWQALRWSLRTVAPGATIRQRVARLQGIRDEGEVTRKLMEARLERAPCFAPSPTSRPTITSGSTAPATRVGSVATRSTCRCACRRWRTSTRR